MNRFLRNIFVLFATIIVALSPGKIKTVVNFRADGNNVVVCAEAWKELGADWSATIDDESVVKLTDNYYEESGNNDKICYIGGTRNFVFGYVGDGATKVSMKLTKGGSHYLILTSFNGAVSVYYSGEREPSASEVAQAVHSRLISISAVSKTPYFIQGKTLSSTDFEITAKYGDGTVKSVNGAKIETPFSDYSAPGTHLITISYTENGVKATSDVKIEVKNAKDIKTYEVTTVKSSYEKRYNFGISDVLVTAYLYDGTQINPEIKYINTDGVDFNSKGSYNAWATFTHNGKEYRGDFTIVITESIGITSLKCEANSAAYYVGQTLTAKNLTVTAFYSDGSYRFISDFDFTPVTFDSIGTKTLSVSVENSGNTVSTTFDVFVGGTKSVKFYLCPGIENDFNVYTGIKNSDFRAECVICYNSNTTQTVCLVPVIEEDVDFSRVGTVAVKLKYTDQWGNVFRGTVDINVTVDRTELEYFIYETCTDSNTGKEYYRITNVNPDYEGETLILPGRTFHGTEIRSFSSLSNLSNTNVRELIIPIGCKYKGNYPECSLERITVEQSYESGLKYLKNAASLGIEVCFDDSITDNDSGIVYAPFGDGYYVAEYFGLGESVTIPASVNGKTVTGIGKDSFSDTGVSFVDIPDSVTYIGQYAFYRCNFESFDMKNVKDVDSYAFSWSKISNLDLKSVTHVGSDAFEYCPITSIKAEKLEEIGSSAFENTKFTEAYFPMVKRIGSVAFSNSSLKIAHFDSLEEALRAFERCSIQTIYITNKNEGEIDLGIPENDILSSKVVIYWKDTKPGFNYDILDDGTISVYQYICNPGETNPETLTVPETIDGYTVTRIGNGRLPVGFKDVKTLELPDTVTSIAPKAFYDCGYSGSAAVEYIKGGNISEIGNNAFDKSVIRSIDTADEFSVGDEAFRTAKYITFPDTITLTGVGFASFFVDGRDDLKLCNSVIVKEGVTEIPYLCFSGAKVDSFTLPSTLKTIGSNAFANNDIKGIELPDGVETIEQGAFIRCANLETIHLPRGITSISQACFCVCKNLKTVTSDSTITAVGSSAFEGCVSLEYFDIASLTEIGLAAFNECSRLTGELVINEAITIVEPYAFGSCNFTSLKLHDGITVIGASAFERNYNMTGILTLPKNLWYFGDKAFDHDYSFKNETLTIPATCEYIGGDFVTYTGFYRKPNFDLKYRQYDNTTHMMYNFAPSTFREYIVEEGNPKYKAIDGVLFTKDGTHLIGFPCAKTLPEGRYEIPEGVTIIDDMCFSRAGYSGGNLKTLVLPDSYIVKANNGPNSLSYNSYYWNSLSAALYSYSGIEAYEVKETNPNYVSVNGVLYSKDMKALICVPQNYRGELIIPEGVESIAEGAFTMDSTSNNYPKYPYMTKLFIPSTVVSFNKNRYNANFFNKLITRYSTEIEIAEGNQYLMMVDGKVQDKTA